MATTKYDSNFERDCHKGCLSNTKYHPEDRIEYFIFHRYEPDFKRGKTLIECKGRFRDSHEARKYLYIRDYLPEGFQLVFVFQNHNTPMPRARKRKDGTKFTMGEWASKNGFKWYTPRTTPKSWRK